MLKWLKTRHAGAPAPMPAEPAGNQDARRAEALRLQGDELLSQDSFAQAALVYGQSLALNPDDAAVLVSLGFIQIETGQAASARQHLTRATLLTPSSHDAFYLLGSACEQTGDPSAAADSFRRALQLQPGLEAARQALCRLLFQSGQLDEAAVAMEAAALQHPEAAWPHLFLGNLHTAGSQPGKAADSYRRAIALAPQDGALHRALGTALQQQGRYEDAAASLREALRLIPEDAATVAQLGTVLFSSGDAGGALASLDRAIALQPGFATALGNRGAVLQSLQRLPEALASLDAALALDGMNLDALNNRGNTLLGMGRPEDALASFDQALRLQPDHAEALNNKGNALHALGRQDLALRSYEAALAIEPAHSRALNNIGNLQSARRRNDEAVAAYDRALRIDPAYAEALANRGNALFNLGRLADALDSYERALALKTDLPWLYGNWLHARMQACDWRDLDAHFRELARRIAAGQPLNPFTILATDLPAADQLHCARNYIQASCPAGELQPATSTGPRSGKIRLGYFSADFHEHATAWLMAELFELQDRTRFELVAFSFGPDVRGPMRERLEAAFDQFHLVHAKSDREVALLARECAIDIAVDLKGFTQNSRPGIFAQRAAPLQVSYLGYPGTMGAPFIDYIVADATVLPPEHRSYYTEKVVTLPDSYQVNDSHRQIAAETPARAQAGLPDGAFVFCCFNNNFKITPDIFNVWMRLLHGVQGSVLWLLEGSSLGAQNLRGEAAARGIDPARLVFAARAPLPAHLARHRLADLFLDTTWCNAHTTASDALWTGLPVVTCIGNTFAARVAASLNRAAGLADLVTESLAAYEALALELARDRGRLAAIRERLSRDRATHPLFDTRRFSRNLDAAFALMQGRHASGQPPDHFSVAAVQV
ncbi:MAG: tetratricopeptide repeat protein [Comamonadaceae bacterium]|nr:MAG: tetratricopeptide repeat protein [Comamonadaceae bacterium]